MSREELQALGKRLREARDRSRRIASQQQREMRGKTVPRGAPTSTAVLPIDPLLSRARAALKRVTDALRKLNKPTPV